VAKWKESTFRRRAQQKERYEQYRRELAESLELALSHQRQGSPDPYSDGDRDYALMGGTEDYGQPG